VSILVILTTPIHLQACPEAMGSMYAIRCSEENALKALSSLPTTLPTLQSDVSLAAVNGRLSVVLSGEESALKAVLANLPPRSACIPIPSQYAFHSPLMQPLASAYRELLKEIEFGTLLPGVEFISTVKGRAVSSGELASAEYWIEHMVQPVRYIDAVVQSYSAGGRTFMEMGPSDVLSKMCRQILTPLTAERKRAGMDVEECEIVASLV
jgi:acyl transferase domain-containing protein